MAAGTDPLNYSHVPGDIDGDRIPDFPGENQTEPEDDNGFSEWLLIGIGVVGILVILIIIFLKRKRKK